jgi:hypothetical protein
MRGRVTRALKQRMFVLSRQLSPDDESTEVFEVLGSIGNVRDLILIFIVSNISLFIELYSYYIISYEMYLHGLCLKTYTL